MNYEKVYYQIINKAIFEENKAIRYKGNGVYYEIHHIIPKSLNGTDNKNNLVLLTAREHFICHWLLVKRYDKNTNERNKMLFAFHRMCYSMTGERVNNSKCFEKYRIELNENISEMFSKTTKGKLNHQYNKKWYTNSDTGESKPFLIKPNEKWILGRNLFKGQCSTLQHIKKNIENKNKAEKLWKFFKEKDLPSISELNKLTNIPIQTISWLFLKYIDEYKNKNQQKV